MGMLFVKYSKVEIEERGVRAIRANFGVDLLINVSVDWNFRLLMKNVNVKNKIFVFRV